MIRLAFHSLIFQHQNSFGGDGHLIAIRHALENWKAIWEIYSSRLSSGPPHLMVGRDVQLTPENAWKRIGFIRHSPEYWLLASVIVGRLTRTDPWPADRSREGDEDGDIWPRIGDGEEEIASLEPSSAGTETPDRVLKQYDQTSMQQVNKLITEFKKVQIC